MNQTLVDTGVGDKGAGTSSLADPRSLQNSANSLTRKGSGKLHKIIDNVTVYYGIIIRIHLYILIGIYIRIPLVHSNKPKQVPTMSSELRWFLYWLAQQLTKEEAEAIVRVENLPARILHDKLPAYGVFIELNKQG